MAGVGIVIVTYNSQAEIGACLDAALPRCTDLVVVDNASGDGTVGEVQRRGARLIGNRENRGFAAAVNQGVAALNCSYILLLNPDAVLKTGVEPLQAACDLPGSAGAGGCMMNADGSPQVGFMVRALPTPSALILEALLLNRIWPHNSVNQRYRGLHLDYSKRIEVEQPAGAFLMFRRAVWSELGGFDEGFHPLWFEDVDFCRRVRDRGYRLYYVPDAVVNHTGGHSIPQLPVEVRRFYWYRSLLRYSAKYFRPAELKGVSLAVVVGSLLRAMGESFRCVTLRPFAGSGRIVRLAGQCFRAGWADGKNITVRRF